MYRLKTYCQRRLIIALVAVAVLVGPPVMVTISSHENQAPQAIAQAPADDGSTPDASGGGDEVTSSGYSWSD